MSYPSYQGEFEYEYAGELETGHDRESECEFESEYESEQFFPLLGLVARFALQGLGRLAARGIAKRAARKVAGKAGRHAVNQSDRNRRDRNKGNRNRRRQHEFEAEFETERTYEIDPYIARLITRLGSGELKRESEFEARAEAEYEFIAAPMSESEVMMENLAYRAAESESEAEAEAFLGALVPVSARLFPKSSSQVINAISPPLIEGVASLAKVLHKSPKARPLLRTVPYILQGTMRTLTYHAQEGKPLSQTTALRVLAANTAKVLDNQRQVAQVMKKSHRAQHHHSKMNGRRQATHA